MTEDEPGGATDGLTAGETDGATDGAADGESPSAAGLTPDELAGIVDLFGGLTLEDLERALEELAFKRGVEIDGDEVEAAVDGAVSAYALVRYGTGGQTDAKDTGGQTDAKADRDLLVPGPTAFPTLPANAEDLPHILDVPTRRVDRSAAGQAVAERLREDAANAIEAGDEASMQALFDVTYDVDVWSDTVDVDGVRERLAGALEDA
ncbi:DUF7109 family protein [Halobellus sp. GM3]|uniref:DUF7109 family protein n=1 Tax=Halobellus sp. GM3 TaxID=3458410 RepID=UPI00403DE804